MGRDGLLGHLRAINLRQVRGNLTMGQPLRRQRDHQIINSGQSPLPLATITTLVVNSCSWGQGEFEVGEVAGAGPVEWVAVPVGVRPDQVDCGGGAGVFGAGPG